MRGMLSCFFSAFLPILLSSPAAFPQTPDATAAPLREIRADGTKTLSAAQAVSLSGLAPGTQASKKDFQSAADLLLATGLFSKVGFNFQSRPDGVYLIFRVVEAPRVPVYFDNIPWFSDSELADAIRAKLPFFDGTLPEACA